MTKAAAHFVDSDKTGTSGLDSWTSNNYSARPPVAGVTGISTPQELQDITDDLTGDYELLNDIDMTDFDFTPIGRDSAVGGANPFIGTFDGRYYTISNLTIDVTGKSIAFHTGVGLFYWINKVGVNEGTIRRVVLTDVTIKNDTVSNPLGRLGSVGLLVGIASAESVIEEVFASGSISAYLNVLNTAGIVGQLGTSTDLTRCGAVVTITSTDGITDNVSGLVGLHGSGTTLTDCYSQATINHQDAGENSSDVGGLCGQQDGTPDSINCYSAVTFNIADTTPANLGGFVGNGATATFTDCFWDGTLASTLDDIGDLGDVAGITKSTTTAMYQEATFTNWDFDTVWKIDEGSGYPSHQWIVNPNQIKTGEQNRTTAMPTDWAHLEGEKVQILQDGSHTADQTVTGGDVTLTGTVNHVGLKYTSTLIPMKLDGEVNVKRIRHIVPNVNESVGGNYGRDEDDLLSMVLRDSDDVMDEDAALHTGNVELPFPGRFDRQGDIVITQDVPLPMNVLGIGVWHSQEAI